MNILITGKKDLSLKLSQLLSTDNEVMMVSISGGYDIGNVSEWAHEFKNYDLIINCAYDNFSQISVMEEFCNMWGHNEDKKIINIGSMVTDYARSEETVDTEYFPYRVHKQSLQLAFNKLVKKVKCDMKLINPGPFESNMTIHLSVPMMTINDIAINIIDIINNKLIKRVDLWK